MRLVTRIIIGSFENPIFCGYFSVDSINGLHSLTERLPTLRILRMKSGDMWRTFLCFRLYARVARGKIKRPIIKYMIQFPDALGKLKVTLTLIYTSVSV